MQTTHVTLASSIEDDIIEWYKAATPGDILSIAMPQYEWTVCLTRHYCGVIWKPPGWQAARLGMCRDVMRILSRFLYTQRQCDTQQAEASLGRRVATRDRHTEARAACPRS